MSRLEEIKERCEKAPEPLWEVVGDSVCGDYSYVRKERSHWPITERRWGPDHFAINEFIAHSRDDIPWLVSQLEKAIELAHYVIATEGCNLHSRHLKAKKFLEHCK